MLSYFELKCSIDELKSVDVAIVIYFILLDELSACFNGLSKLIE